MGSRNSADGENSKFYLRGFLKTEKFFSFPCQFRTDDGFQKEKNVLLEPMYLVNDFKVSLFVWVLTKLSFILDIGLLNRKDCFSEILLLSYEKPKFWQKIHLILMT